MKDKKGHRFAQVPVTTRDSARNDPDPINQSHTICQIQARMSEIRGTGLKLSLERLYKDDLGRPIPIVYDITADGRYIFEPCASNLSMSTRTR
jgi:hypothetical protein